MRSFGGTALLMVLALLCVPAAHAQFASAVVGSDRGGTTDDYDDPNAVLGSPERWTPNWAGGADDPVTIINPEWGYHTPDGTGNWPHDQVFSFGPGGSIEVAFDGPVEDDPLNPFGIDLIVFGNAAFINQWPDPILTDPALLFGDDLGTIEVSQDGIDWVTVTPPYADALYPTTGWADADHTAASDFLLPVDPGLTLSDFDGLTEAQALVLYAGSGGGTGIDLAGTGLDWIQYVRVSNLNAEAVVDIDAFADVAPIPEPSLLLVAGAAMMLGLRRRTRA